jgi:hypothetical protein
MHDKSLVDSHDRIRSWDHCYGYFQSGSEDGELASLHLAFYLASWGMYRGSSFLLQKDYLIHLEVVRKVREKKESSLNRLSFNEYEKNEGCLRKELFDLIKCIKKLYQPNNATDTLVSKILLGTLVCIPAYDQFFIDGLRKSGLSFSNLNEQNFQEMMEWCLERRGEFEQAQMEIEKKTIKYPIMKIIDMYFWSVGYKL